MADLSFLDWPFFDDRHRALAERARSFAASRVAPLAGNHTEADLDDLCRGFVKALAEEDFLSLSVSADGSALDVRAICLIREILGYHDGLADFSFVMQGLGAGPISLFGSDGQRARYLPEIAAGRRIAALGMSEPNAGSDFAGITTTAVRDGNGYRLDGEKMWISNAGIADVYTVFAKTDPAAGAKGISAFIVEADDPGFSVAERIPLIAPHPLGRLAFENCCIPADRLIGGEGAGFRIAMSNLDIFRSSVGAAALGFARRALDEACRWSNERQVFGSPLASFQTTQGKLGQMATEIDAAALLVYRAAWLKDTAGVRVTREASMAKMYATEMAQKVIDEAVQLHGGYGLVLGAPVEKLYREVRALRIYEGTTEINRMVIAGQTLARFAEGQ
ncbi:acyl-CoA dehydrogenase family protein [Oceanibacterium hippocampi]|uniref:Acyl-CoA dehydrogenase n=1 Tax=Oceanibacterium hippocampi TaxID=745714 RepID=A0A1Y5TZB1_9PROT|nr:acyl-CoA dehydrogenase family protein [Oceanibacterium hippocampi]SLN77430.1 Acyl-CoA dehydrogenase [Oceanibacterium hippocampi]